MDKSSIRHAFITFSPLQVIRKGLPDEKTGQADLLALHTPYILLSASKEWRNEIDKASIQQLEKNLE